MTRELKRELTRSTARNYSWRGNEWSSRPDCDRDFLWSILDIEEHFVEDEKDEICDRRREVTQQDITIITSSHQFPNCAPTSRQISQLIDFSVSWLIWWSHRRIEKTQRERYKSVAIRYSAAFDNWPWDSAKIEHIRDPRMRSKRISHTRQQDRETCPVSLSPLFPLSFSESLLWVT